MAERTNETKGQRNRFSEEDIKRKLYGDKTIERPEPSKAQRPEVVPPKPQPIPPVLVTQKPAVPARGLFDASRAVPAPGEAVPKESMKEKRGEASPGPAVFARAEQDQAETRKAQQELSTYKEKMTQVEKQLSQAEELNERLKKKVTQQKRIESIFDKCSQFATNITRDKTLLIVPLVAVIVLLGLLFMVRGKMVQPSETKAPEAVVPASPAPAVAPATAANPALTAAPAPKSTSAPAAKPIEEKPVAAPAAATSGQKQYTIQVAEYALQEAADRFVEQLKQEGYEVKTQTIYRTNDKSKPYFKVSIGIFNSLDEAKRFNEAFQQKKGIADSFIREWRP